MADRQPIPDLQASLRLGREGVQFERALRIFAFLLREWQKHQACNGINAISFDKLVTFCSRFWSALFRKDGPSGLTLFSSHLGLEHDQDKLITFPIPLTEIPGMHGRGMAIVDGNRPPEFITSVLVKLQRERICPYFNISNSKQLEATELDPQASVGESERTNVEADVIYTDAQSFLHDFSRREYDAIVELGYALRTLPAEEMRAIGTHDTAKKAIEDIEREFRYMDKPRKELLQLVEADQDFKTVSNQLKRYTDEAVRKSSTNRQSYQKARQLVIEGLSSDKSKTIFNDLQSEACTIWECPDVIALAKKAMPADAFVAFIRTLANIKERFKNKSRITDGAKEELRLEAVACHSLGLQWLPSDVAQIFVGGEVAHFRGDFKERLRREIEKIV